MHLAALALCFTVCRRFGRFVLRRVLVELQTAGAPVRMIAGIVIAGVTAMLVALALFTT